MENLNTLSQIIEKNDFEAIHFTLEIENEDFPLKNVKITKSSTPVNKPTTRGGVYFSEKEVFKMSAIVEDTSIISKLSNYMLGPNTEFKKLIITTKNFPNEKQNTLSIFANLTNSIQRSNEIELNMVIMDTQVNS